MKLLTLRKSIHNSLGNSMPMFLFCLMHSTACNLLNNSSIYSFTIIHSLRFYSFIIINSYNNSLDNFVSKLNVSLLLVTSQLPQNGVKQWSSTFFTKSPPLKKCESESSHPIKKRLLLFESFCPEIYAESFYTKTRFTQGTAKAIY